MSTEPIDIALFLLIFFGPIVVFLATAHGRERSEQRAATRRYGKRS